MKWCTFRSAMALDSGTKLGSYEIRAPLGAGGMGEVYRAWDSKLDREVAIKVLPEQLAADADALARFEREAKAVAALAHPNILSIYDFGTHADTAYAVMELLEGETLGQRLETGALPPRKATELGRQIARALDAAHQKGIVHRDLKPDNIFITNDGRAKVLDFGLALSTMTSTAETQGPTRTSLTEPGTVMGTVGYMSPEQVRGQAADHRSDIFSFGSVMYETLTGRRTFERETPAEVMTGILREDVPELAQSAGVPPALERIVRRCLEKRPEERFQSARDLAFAIDNVTGPTTSPAVAVGAAPAAPRRSTAFVALVGLAMLVLGLLAGLAIRSGGNPPAASEPVRVRALTVAGRDSQPSASPDGRMIAFTSQRDGDPRIWIKQLVGGGEEPLTEGPDSDPRFSPDGASVLFLREERDLMSVYRQALVGGQARKLVEDAQEAEWAPDGRSIVFIRSHVREGARLSEVGIADAQQGGERILYQSAFSIYGARWSLDGGRIVVVESSVTGNVADYGLVTIDVASGTADRFIPGETRSPLSLVAWNGTGNELVFARAGSIVGDQGDPVSRVVKYDLTSGREQVLFWAEHLFPLQGMRVDVTRFDVVGPGALVFDQTHVRQFLVEVGPTGGSSRSLTRGQGRDRQPAYSPDGKRVAFASNRSGNLDLWTLELGTGALQQLTDDEAQDWDPGWSPDGRHILWSSERGGHLEIWMANADGSSARQVTRDGLDAENPTMGGSGEWIVYWSANPDKIGVWKIRPDGSEATRLVEGPYLQPEVSPDGRHAAFVLIELEELRSVVNVVDTETGELHPYPFEVSLRLQSSGIIMGRCRWLPDGSAIAFVGQDEEGRTGIYLQDFVPGQDTTSTRRKLAGFSTDYITESFGISPDGKRLTIAALEPTQRLVLAEGVPGIVPPPR